MIQSMEVISVNIWLMLISLCNLLLLFLILKKFLYKPVKKVMSMRRGELEEKYSEAERTALQAYADKTEWEQKLQSVQGQANDILKKASENAAQNSQRIISEAKSKADEIILRAESEAEYERRKASDSIKHEIADISVTIAEKLLSRELDENDHKNIIDTFINEIGENNGGHK